MTKKLFQMEASSNLSPEQHSLFRQVVGKLMHIQEDVKAIQFSLLQRSRELATPSDDSLARLKHLVRFLLGTLGHVQATRAKEGTSTIDVAVDSDWAGCRSTRKSTDFVCVRLLGCPIYSSARTQTAQAQSSAEGELGGIHRGALQGLYAQNLWASLFDQILPISIGTDSDAGRALSTRRGVGRVRHLEVRQLYIQKLTNDGRVKVYRRPGSENEADIGTKPLERELLFKHLRSLGTMEVDNTGRIGELPNGHSKPVGRNSPQVRQAALMALLAGLVSPCRASGTASDSYPEHLETQQDYADIWVLILAMIVFGLTSWAVCCGSWAFILWQKSKQVDSAHVSECSFKQVDKPIHPLFQPTAAIEPERHVSKRHVLVQSMTTYTWLRGVSHPRFLPLRNSSEGAWVDTHHRSE